MTGLKSSTEQLILRSLIVASLLSLGVSLWSTQTLFQILSEKTALPQRQQLLKGLESVRTGLLLAEVYRRDALLSHIANDAKLQAVQLQMQSELRDLRQITALGPAQNQALVSLDSQIKAFNASPSVESRDMKAIESMDDLISRIEQGVQDKVIAHHADHVRRLEADFSIRAVLTIWVSIIVLGLFYLFKRYIVQRNLAEEKIKSLNGELETANARLAKQATEDPLTNLLNRRGLENALSAEGNRVERSASSIVALLLDCDDFKRINESFGHAVGDIVLMEMAKRLADAIRITDYACRVGGDEFVILLPDTGVNEAFSVAERLRLNVADSPILIADETVRITASFGVAQLPYGLSSVEELLSITRLALKRSKTYGKNRVSSASGDSAFDVEGLIDSLVSGRGLRVFSQEIMDIATGKPVALEFLSRGPEGEFERPDDLFRLSKERNVLTLVDLGCLKKSLYVSENQAIDCRLHLNIFPSTLVDTPVESLLVLFANRQQQVCLEISEHEFLGDPGYLSVHLKELREAGVLIALDDCGFGRTSLESLIELEPDFVKLDSVCTRGICQDRSRRRLLERMIKLLRSSGAELIAEGIESQEDCQILSSLGVQYAQGYLWTQPAAVDGTIVPSRSPVAEAVT